MAQATYKALMLDVDGTTVPMGGFDRLPTDKVRYAVRKLHGRVKICLATGRTIHEARPVIDAFGGVDLCVLNGGAVLYDPMKNSIVESHCLGKGTLQSILDVAHELPNSSIELSTLEKTILFSEPYDPEKITGLYLVNLDAVQAEYYSQKLKAIPNISFHISTRNFSDYLVIAITDINGTKQRAIEHAMKYLSVKPEEIVAVGDGENDLPMIISAGMGVAMGNAADGLKSVADYIAPSVNEDGLVDVIEKFFPEG